MISRRNNTADPVDGVEWSGGADEVTMKRTTDIARASRGQRITYRDDFHGPSQRIFAVPGGGTASWSCFGGGWHVDYNRNRPGSSVGL